MDSDSAHHTDINGSRKAPSRSKPTTTLDAALAYVERGWAPIPIPYRTKAPILDGWPDLRITAETAHQYFNGKEQNIGLITGQASGGLADIDLDCPEAIEVASYLLPPTKSVFGRASARGAHRQYLSDLWESIDTARTSFREPGSGAVLVEILCSTRMATAQVVAPPSVHEEGEAIRWEVHGEPAQVSGEALHRAVRAVAAAALLARH